MLKLVLDHVSWLFFPGRFLFPATREKNHKVMGWEAVRFVESQAELQAVTKATGDVFLGGQGNAFLETLLGPQSVFTLDHEQHQLSRRIVAPALSRRMADNFEQTADHLIDRAFDKVRSHRFTAMSRWSRELTMRIMCKVVMEIDDAETAHRLFRRFESATSYMANIVSYTKCMWRPNGKLSFGALAARVVRGVDEVIYDAIRERKRQGARGESPLDALIRGQDQHAYDDAFIRDNIVALLAAGYETTGAAITWMLYWVDRTDSYSVLQAKRNAGDTEYLTAFRNECLRYCPPVEILPRRVAEDRVEKAAEILPDLADRARHGKPPMVCPFVHRAHHDESVHANPREFTPERFIGRSYSPTEFFPFGLGRRFCLGAVLGQRLMDRVLNRLLAADLRLDFWSKSFAPVRRNVVIWPGVFMVARCSRKRADP